MPLSRLEREVLNDSVLKIQSIQSALEKVDDEKVPEMQEIEQCLDSADKSLRTVLREGLEWGSRKGENGGGV